MIERWTIEHSDTEDPVCHIMVRNNLSTEILFEYLGKELGIDPEKLWFGTKLNASMASTIDAFELMPFFLCTRLSNERRDKKGRFCK